MKFSPALLAMLGMSVFVHAQDPPRQDTSGETPWNAVCCYEKGRLDQGELLTVIFRIHHFSEAGKPGYLAEAEKLLKPYLTPAKGHMEWSEPAGILQITDTKENIKQLKEILKLNHVPDLPVLIEAKVVELRWNKDLEIGLAGDPTAGFAMFIEPSASEAFLKRFESNFQPSAALAGGTFQGSTFRFSSVSSHQGTIAGIIQAFLERGRASILSNPRVVVRNGEKATLNAGEKIPYAASTQFNATVPVTTIGYEQTGVTLQVTPHIMGPDYLELHLFSKVSAVLGQIILAQGSGTTVSTPSFTNREATTAVTVREGEEIVIGGLLRKETVIIRRGLPFLMDIPILGVLFSRHDETEVTQEIVFLIRPQILHLERESPHRVFDPAQEKK